MTVDDMFRRAVRRWPERTFVVSDDRTFSYSELDVLVERAAGGLLALGAGPGDRVALWMSNIWEWVVIQFAVTRMGGILTPLNTRLRTDDLAHALRDSGARFLVTQADADGFSYLDIVRDILSEMGGDDTLQNVVVARSTDAEKSPFLPFELLLDLAPEPTIKPTPTRDIHDTAYILYTSGTTSLPKGVMLSHANLNNAMNIAGTLRDAERIFLAYPLFAITGCHNAVLALSLVGGAVVLQQRFEAETAIGLIERHQCTGLGGIIGIVEEIVGARGFSQRRVAKLRLAVVFPRRPEHYELLLKLGVDAASTGYGMTETAGPVTHVVDLDLDSMTAEGHSWPGNEIRIEDEDGNAAPPGQDGALLVRSPQVMRGYFNNPEATRRAIDSEGWLHTGDVGHLDADGRLTWVGRHSDIFKCSGFNVASREVEAFLGTHPAVEEVAVAGVPDSKKGEVGAAFVVLRPGRDLSFGDLKEFCTGRIASYKIPGHLHLLPTFPKTASGKVRKVELKEIHRSSAGNNRVPGGTGP